MRSNGVGLGWIFLMAVGQGHAGDATAQGSPSFEGSKGPVAVAGHGLDTSAVDVGSRPAAGAVMPSSGDVPELVFAEYCESEEWCPVASHDFGTVATGSSGAHLNGWLVNRSGTIPATNLGFQSDATFPFMSSFGSCHLVDELPPGAACQVAVKFAPSAPGPVTGALTITSAEGAVTAVTLMGTGGNDFMLYGQLHDWETMQGIWGMVNASFADTPEYSSELADDFLVPEANDWVIRKVGLEIMILPPGVPGEVPDILIDVRVVPDVDGRPGEAPVCSAPSSQIEFWEPPINERRVEVALSSPCTLSPGHYWLLVGLPFNSFFEPKPYWGLQFVTDFDETTGDPPIHLNPPVWRNPGLGLGGCTVWTPIYPPACGLQDWYPFQVAYDTVFWLIGGIAIDPIFADDFELE